MEVYCENLIESIDFMYCFMFKEHL